MRQLFLIEKARRTTNHDICNVKGKCEYLQRTSRPDTSQPYYCLDVHNGCHPNKKVIEGVERIRENRPEEDLESSRFHSRQISKAGKRVPSPWHV